MHPQGNSGSTTGKISGIISNQIVEQFALRATPQEEADVQGSPRPVVYLQYRIQGGNKRAMLFPGLVKISN